MSKQFGTAAILAGGKSRGQMNKKAISLKQQKEMSQFIVEQVKQIFSDVVLITDTPWVYEDLPVRICEDIYSNHGPMAGIHTAMKNSITEYVYILACDMPIINEEYISYMLHKLSVEKAHACITLNGGWVEPFNAFYSTKLFYRMGDSMAKGENSIYNFLRKEHTLVIDEATARSYDQKLAMFKNIDTIQEYEKLKRLYL